MQKITLEFNNSIYDHIMFFLGNIPQNLLNINNETKVKVNNNLKQNSNFENNYFKSDKHQMAYQLLNYKANIFNDELGITRKHRVDKKLANNWMKEKQKIFHPDKNMEEKDGINYKEISDMINDIYGELVGSK
jgi:tRNA A37 N6-isopentenylltransferase MiaA